MVRMIDGEERRRLLARTVWQIIRRDGFEAASVRAVAAGAQLSTGSVRHFFTTQDELHVFAMEALVEHMGERVRALLDTAWTSSEHDPGWTPERTRAAVSSVLLELLPLTGERRDLFLAHLQFLTRATVNPTLRPTATRVTEETVNLVDHLVQSLVDTGAARADLDVPSASATLCLLLDGITLRLLTAPSTLGVDQAVRLVDEQLDTWRPS